MSDSVPDDTPESTPERIRYPKARRCPCAVDKFRIFASRNELSVHDPYRWLEHAQNDDVKTFITQQNQLTDEILSKCLVKEDIQNLLRESFNYPKFFCPLVGGQWYFYFKNDGLQNQNVLYIQHSLEDAPKVYLDPNTLSEDGTIAIKDISLSHDGDTVAYQLSKKGSDWVQIRFKSQLMVPEDYPEVLEDIKSTNMSWSRDNLGIFYTRYPNLKSVGNQDGTEISPLLNAKVYYHKVGTSQSEDVLITEFPQHPYYFSRVTVSDCGNYLTNEIEEECNFNLLQFARFQEPVTTKRKFMFIPIITEFESEYHYVANVGSLFYFYTNHEAPRYKVIGINLLHPERASAETWVTIVPENHSAVLTNVVAVNNDKLLTLYLQDATSVLELRYMRTGALLYTFGTNMETVSTIWGNRNVAQIFFEVSSFTSSKKIFACDLTISYEPIILFQESLVQNFDTDAFTVKQEYYVSKDGFTVPMFIVGKKDYEQNGENPCILHGYGGFGINNLPSFNGPLLFFMHRFDGILAIPNIRGGGEFGTNWHDYGKCSHKQNGFDDFHAAAEFLIQNGYTSSSKLAIHGESINGGLLVAASVNQRPELFGAAVAVCGVMDMLRFDKFTTGHTWTSEYGNPSEPTEFKDLQQYSPLHNVKMPAEGQFPPILICTADHDDRVPPLHSYKFISELQAVIGNHVRQTNPLLIRVQQNSGHANRTTAQTIQQWSDILTFLTQSLNLNFII